MRDPECKIIKNLIVLKKLCAKLHASKIKISLTAGAYNILHDGHIKYLMKARAEGDTLIVGIDSNKYVKRIKGHNRPCIDERIRAFTAAGLECVDYVFIYDFEKKLINSVKPDIYVMSSTSRETPDSRSNIQRLVEKYNGRVIILGAQSMTHTSDIINKIKQEKQPENPTKKIIGDPKELKNICDRHKSEEKTIVLTGGVFDVLHEGHLDYLIEAKKRGDILVVDISLDELTRKDKGPGRPHKPDYVRSFLIAGYACVDYIRVVDDWSDTLKLICPDVFIMSTTSYDYGERGKAEKAAVTDICDKQGTKIIELGPEIVSFNNAAKKRSTTSMLKKIKQNK